jgi:hypothetical protein
MAASGEAFAISAAIYLLVSIFVFLLFSFWKRAALTKKFFQPKRYSGDQRPPRLISTLGSWVPQVLALSEAEVIRCAGVDAAMYLKTLKMGIEMFAVVSFLVCAIILPINLTGNEVDTLLATDSDSFSGEPSLGTWWVPPPPPPLAPDSPPAPPQDNDDALSAPDMYASNIPPAPPGLKWWKYLDTVPPLPNPEEVLGPEYVRYGWKYDDGYSVNNYAFTDLDKTTMANIADGDDKLYAHAVVTWAVSLFAFWLLWKYCKEALRLRVFYLLNTRPGGQSHTVLVTDIPGIKSGRMSDRLSGPMLKVIPDSMKDKATAIAGTGSNSMLNVSGQKLVQKAASKVFSSEEEQDPEAASASQRWASNSSKSLTRIDPTTGRWEKPEVWDRAETNLAKPGASPDSMVTEEFEAIYQETFVGAHMVYNTQTSGLDALVKQYDKVKMAASDTVDDYISMKRRGKEMKPKMMTIIGATMGEWGREKYGLKPVKVDSLQFYEERLSALHETILEEQGKAKDQVYASAFVTFNRRKSQVVAAQNLMSEDLTAWRCQPAPGPNEVIWGNLFMRRWERSIRSLFMWICYGLLALFFMIPVAAVQGLISTTTTVSWIQDIPILNAVFASILPTLALKIFLAVLPMILIAMCKFSGMISESQVDFGLLSRFYAFQVITVYFGSFIAGVFANQLEQFIDDPSSILTVLGVSAPQSAIFFMTFLLLSALLTRPLSILRIVPLVLFWVKSKLAGTERAKARLWQDQKASYGARVADDTIAILMGLSFSVMCPIIAPTALIFFLVSFLVWKYQLVYVYNPPYEAGGLLWKNVFNQSCCALFIFQLMMIAVLGVKESIGAPIVVAPLLFITIAFQLSAQSTFWRPMECLALMSANEIDEIEAASPATEVAIRDAKEMYVSPCFKIDLAEHDELVDQCRRMRMVVSEGTTDDDLFVESVVMDNSVEDAHEFVEFVDADGGEGAGESAGNNKQHAV